MIRKSTSSTCRSSAMDVEVGCITSRSARRTASTWRPWERVRAVAARVRARESAGSAEAVSLAGVFRVERLHADCTKVGAIEGDIRLSDAPTYLVESVWENRQCGRGWMGGWQMQEGPETVFRTWCPPALSENKLTSHSANRAHPRTATGSSRFRQRKLSRSRRRGEGRPNSKLVASLGASVGNRRMVLMKVKRPF